MVHLVWAETFKRFSCTQIFCVLHTRSPVTWNCHLRFGSQDQLQSFKNTVQIPCQILCLSQIILVNLSKLRLYLWPAYQLTSFVFTLGFSNFQPNSICGFKWWQISAMRDSHIHMRPAPWPQKVIGSPGVSFIQKLRFFNNYSLSPPFHPLWPFSLCFSHSTQKISGGSIIHANNVSSVRVRLTLLQHGMYEWSLLIVCVESEKHNERDRNDWRGAEKGVVLEK